MADERRTLILTGASQGIGHATVKRFSAAGWRVITASRRAFSEDCPWEAGLISCPWSVTGVFDTVPCPPWRRLHLPARNKRH